MAANGLYASPNGLLSSPGHAFGSNVPDQEANVEFWRFWLSNLGRSSAQQEIAQQAEALGQFTAADQPGESGTAALALPR